MMSTRSNIIVEDGYSRIQLYRHSDGYPEAVLQELEEALAYAWVLPRFEASDFAAALVRAWKTSGGNIYIDGSPRGWEMIHGDVEWVYVLKPKGKVKDGVGDADESEPMVEVYDWHPFWFDTADPNKVAPKPVLRVLLSEARHVGHPWCQ